MILYKKLYKIYSNLKLLYICMYNNRIVSTRKGTGNGNGIIHERLPQVGRENDRLPIHYSGPSSVRSTFGY